ncbi:MAG TPA: type II secretion system protein [Candidatus Paceibacterota bacterium]|nr:hypothetical protein [uncultured archaeon]
MLLKLSNTGFTLVESLVAISILSLSIAATFTAVQNSIQNSTYAKDEITAFYLTQEAMEFIKNIRDENALHSISGQSTNWLASLSNVSSDPCYFGKTCVIDSPLKTVTACSGGFGSCPNLKEDSGTGLFGYTSGGTWLTTNFKREIQFQQVASDEISVIIKISWTSRGIPKSFQVTETLFNRQ